MNGPGDFLGDAPGELQRGLRQRRHRALFALHLPAYGMRQDVFRKEPVDFTGGGEGKDARVKKRLGIVLGIAVVHEVKGDLTGLQQARRIGEAEIFQIMTGAFAEPPTHDPSLIDALDGYHGLRKLAGWTVFRGLG